MPQLIFFVVAGIIAWLGYRAFLREAKRVSERVRRTERETTNRSSGTLVKDPKTGEYRLAKD
ncbi:hypothetical protein [Mesorhizobium xinjiangense]|uniref:hypothetical protein n=1 Tax=Mesorhizobium xinjiangense TaxID=2678685 RepID=UPI0012EED4C1|nr:hypothetical protein [Mesorhizobium xinjiangense]